ncbi:MAG: MmcQ/YjbR family DNA-binding protein [Ilumatobacteraceae bacterium]
MAVTIDDVREIASGLERAYEAVVRDRVKFRVGSIVFLAFSRDDSMMGFAFPKEERLALVESRPDTFVLPEQRDMRYNWVVARLDRLDRDELEEIVVDAWSMCVPKKLVAAYHDRLTRGS